MVGYRPWRFLKGFLERSGRAQLAQRRDGRRIPVARRLHWFGGKPTDSRFGRGQTSGSSAEFEFMWRTRLAVYFTEPRPGRPRRGPGQPSRSADSAIPDDKGLVISDIRHSHPARSLVSNSVGETVFRSRIRWVTLPATRTEHNLHCYRIVNPLRRDYKLALDIVVTSQVCLVCI